MKYIKFFLISIMGVILLSEKVNAQTYTPTTNLFENTQTNYLLYMANSQVANFTGKDYVAFQIDYNYYLVVGDYNSVSNNNLILDNCTIFSATRETSGTYNYNYVYNKSEESSTAIYLNYNIVSNINTSKSSSSPTFEDLKYQNECIVIFIFVLGLLFAVFLLNGRR